MTTSVRREPHAARRGGIWRYAPGPDVPAASLEGFAIDATDGFVGTVGVARDEPAGAYLIALCGPWNGGRTAMIPAGLISSVESLARAVHLGCSLQQLRDAPAFENDRYQDAAYRGELTAHYESLGASRRPAGARAARLTGAILPWAAMFADRSRG